MALLLRRVRRVQDHRLTAALAAALALSPAAVGAQPAPTASEADTGEAEALGRSASEVDALLGRLTDGSSADRAAAAAEVQRSLESDDIPAIRARLLAPTRLDLDRVRGVMVRAVRTVTANRPNAEYDLLALLLEQPRSREADFAVERIVLARALGGMRSADAGRALVALSADFNAVFRQEVGRIVRGQLRDYVLPALIELRNPSEGMRIFMRQTRAALRRVTPGEAVQLRDNALLAEVLRAFASIRQPDAVRVVASFVNSDRVQVRDAARAAIQQYGPMAVVALREAYEAYEGHAPDASWGWERTALELYGANDRRRGEEVAARFEQGLRAAREGRHEDMIGHFRYVLARHPEFDRKAEMVAPLVAYARALEASDAGRAEAVYRMALWVEPSGPRSRSLRGAILFIEAERALQRGVADPELYRRVLRVDPANARARSQLDAVAQEEVLRARRRHRVLRALGLLAVALGLLWAMVKGPLRPRPRVEAPEPEAPPEAA
ncbi:MAG: hypothetical protein R3A52_26075 [Polyangiales bacterium]